MFGGTSDAELNTLGNFPTMEYAISGSTILYCAAGDWL
jgi:hypothetical protein